MSHPNDMTEWPAITCQRGHLAHEHRFVEVALGGGHGYLDLTPIPTRLARRFALAIWPPELYPVDGGPYCPAHDAVSATIVSHRVWEPVETTLALHVCDSAPEGSAMLDLGAQIGWYSILAASSGLTATAVDADAANLELVRQSARANGWHGRVLTVEERIGPDSVPWPSTDPVAGAKRWRFVKIDLEGAEAEALAMLRPALTAGLVDHLLLEVSPVFRGKPHYVEMVRRLTDDGYVAYRLPAKARPPRILDDPADQLVRLHDPSAIDAHQENLWCRHESAAW